MNKKHHFHFALAGSLLTIVFLITVNLLTSPKVLWFLYPSFALLMWPVGVAFISHRAYRLQALFGSVIVAAFLITVNIVHSPEHYWFVYAVFPFVWWPVTAFLGSRAKTLAFAFLASMATIVYYAACNAVMSPEYPWMIYPAFAVLWWPLSLYFVRKSDYYGFSVAGCILIAAFFITVNWVSTPHTVWAIYPIFASLWWPLSLYYFGRKPKPAG